MPYIYRIRTHASLDRLESLIEQRLQPGADKRRIDRRIWDLFGERWAVMFTDLAGFSRNVAQYGIVHFLQTIFESQRVLVPCIEDHDGILLKTEGDSMLIIFRRVDNAARCAVDMQRRLKEYNRDRPEEEKIELCLGIGYGDVLRIGDDDVFGAEVNAASKLGEDTAGPWDILVTENVYQRIRDEPHYGFEPIDYSPPGAKAAYRLVVRGKVPPGERGS
ncbi:MAG: adenylate/guanylate cyclase domain-containing protein [Deltaproteobacteria bacterium]|nr:MAG: adenylate/guanylate cyclase domain-containing protein [Deltaproteobacteria bacterium]